MPNRFAGAALVPGARPCWPPPPRASSVHVFTRACCNGGAQGKPCIPQGSKMYCKKCYKRLIRDK
jgi:hypothetical protein